MSEIVTKTNQGLTRAREIYQTRDKRAKELKAQGKPVLGYFCLYPVLELMTALDLVPFRLLGDIHEPISKADACLPTIVCPFVRSALDIGLKGRYDFLNGVVMCHSCEVAEKTAHIWRTYLTPAYFHFIDTPHTTHRAARERFREEIAEFQKTLEKLAGKKVSSARLKEAIELHNLQRKLVRELYDLRKPDPPLISGTETIQVMVALMSLPVQEGIALLQQIIQEVQERKDSPPKKPARLLVWGSIMDNTALVEMIEQLDANVVMDDTCVGSRAYFDNVKLTEDPLEGLAEHYLVDIKCPRTFRDTEMGTAKKSYIQDLKSRFAYLGQFARDWHVNGVILQSVRYCDIHGYEVPGVKDYFNHIGLPNTYLEWDYSKAALAPLRTRVQAFLELIG